MNRSFWRWKFFSCRKIIKIFVNFQRPKIFQTCNQCLEFSICNQSRDYFFNPTSCNRGVSELWHLYKLQAASAQFLDVLSNRRRLYGCSAHSPQCITAKLDFKSSRPSAVKKPSTGNHSSMSLKA